MGLIQVQRGRNRRLLTGILSGLIGRSLAMAAPLFVMPILLSYLGVVQFGLWMTVASLTSMALFMDLGLGNGLLTRLADCHGKKDLDRAREYVSSAYTVLVVVAFALLLLTLFAKNTGILAYFLASAPDGSGEDYERLVMVSICAFALGIPVSLIQRIQYACQRAWQSNAWLAAGAAVSVIVTMWAVRAGLPGWLVVACYAMTPVVMLGISNFVFFIAQQPKLAPSPNFISRESVVDLLSLGARFLMLSVVTSIALNIDNIIIADQLGLAAVTDYAVLAKLSAVLGMLVTVIFLPLWPANGEALARKDYAWVRMSARRMSIGGGVIVGAVACGLVVFSEPIMQLWMGRTFMNQQVLLAWLVTLSVLMAICSPFLMIMNSVGALKEQVIGWVLYLCVSAVVKYILVAELGVVSVAVVSAVCYLVFVMPFIFIGARRITNN